MPCRGSHYTRDSGVAFLNEAKGKAADCVCGKGCSGTQGLDERCCVGVHSVFIQAGERKAQEKPVMGQLANCAEVGV